MFNLLWIATALYGALQTNPALTEEEAVTLSLKRSPSLTLVAQQWKAAQAEIQVQRSTLRPKVNVSGSATQYDERFTAAVGGSVIETAPDHTELLSATLSLNLDVSGRIASSLSQARLTALSRQYDVQTIADSEGLEARTEFYAVLRARERITVAEASLTANKDLLRVAQKLNQAGVGLKVDVLRAETEVANATRQLSDALTKLRIAKSNLNIRLGRPAESELSLDETIAPDVFATTDWNRVQSEALAKRPEILSAMVQVKAAEYGIRLARASLDPQVSLQLGSNYYPTLSFQNPRSSVSYVSISVSIPLFDGGEASAQKQKANALLSEAKARLELASDSATTESYQRFQELLQARENVKSLEATVRESQEARRLAQVRYDAQAGIYADVTDTQSALVLAQQNLADARYDERVATARLRKAMGQSVPLKNFLDIEQEAQSKSPGTGSTK